MKALEADQILWDEVLKKNSKDVYEFYLQERPDGFFVEEARKRLDEFDAAPDIRAWQIAERGNSKASYQEYLNKFPRGRFASEAEKQLSRFNRAEEDRRWQSAEAEGSAEGYLRYLRRHPAGIFASVAKLRLKTLGVAFSLPEEVIGSFLTNSVGIEFAWIPKGEFKMGTPSSEESPFNEPTQRVVTFQNGFWMARFLVTQSQYKTVMGTNPSFFSKGSKKHFPVDRVSWNDAKAFVSKLNALDDGFVYSLPSEAEWEYAARAGTTTTFVFGDSLCSEQANFDGNNPYGEAPQGSFLMRTTEVGSYHSNPWGLYDMHGNLWEWVEDVYQNSYEGLPSDGSANTTGADCSERVLRGGSWFSSGHNCRSAVREVRTAPARYNYIGFRVVARTR